MKRGWMVLALFCVTRLAWAAAPGPQPGAADAWLLIDIESAQTLYAQRAEARLDPGGFSRLMWAYLAGAARARGRLPDAQRLGSGTLSVGDALPVLGVRDDEDVLRALARALAGGDAEALALMNQEARRLGMAGTEFRALEGSFQPGQRSSLQDLARLVTALWREYPREAARLGERELRLPAGPRPNPNPLLWQDAANDGLLFAPGRVAATARRGPRHLLALVAGPAGDDEALARDAQRLLNAGFQDFDTVRLYPAGQVVATLEVLGGRRNMVKAGFSEDCLVAVPRGRAGALKLSLITRAPLLAPLLPGQNVASLRVSLDGEVLGERALQALEEVPEAALPARLWQDLNHWLKQEP